MECTAKHPVRLRHAIRPASIFRSWLLPLFLTALSFTLCAAPALCVNYFVSPTGDDDNDGFDSSGVVDSAGGISADPLFVNPAGGDFSLQGGSPAINTGLYLGYDYCGSAPEMGAIEYCVNQAPVIDVPEPQTTKPDGHGFGMITCAKIVDVHGGSISATSEPGKGTTCRVELPVS
ncbi:MAG: ATP-binding protein [Candidatus Zixiibacteriota bacterium]